MHPDTQFTPTIARDLVASAIARGLIHPSTVPPVPEHYWNKGKRVANLAAGLTARGTPRKPIRNDPELAGLHGKERAKMISRLWYRQHRRAAQ